MGSQMARTKRETPEENERKPVNLLSLPNELLVRILSFLPETHDKVKMRYVSRKLRSISETPSLWRDFVWPDCNPREERCLENVMKTCGMHIRRLSFHHLNQPTAIPPSEYTALKSIEVSKMAKMLQYCNNLTHLSLPAFGDMNSRKIDIDKQLREGIREMRQLEMLSVHCHADSIEPYLNLKTTLKELTIHTVIHDKKDVKAFQNWMMNGFTPPNLNIVAHRVSTSTTMIMFKQFLVPAWPLWNSRVPAGRTACLRLYSSYKAPLNLFQSMPVFQLRYGETAVLPIVKSQCIGNSGLLTVTDRGDGGSTMMYKAKACDLILGKDIVHIIRSCYEELQTANNFTNLTELDIHEFSSFDANQLVLSYPHLQRLNLHNYNRKKLRLDDLQTIATCCCNLQGLKLANTERSDVQYCIKLWEILSGMKLTHLSIDDSFFVVTDDIQSKQLITLFKQCTQLQALELHSALHVHGISNDYKVLSYFPSLEYCRLTCTEQSTTCVQDILTTCEKLKCFHCTFASFEQLSLSSVYNNNLQQLYIFSMATNLDDNFMDTVSAHGGLIHVSFLVHSMTLRGITTLIKNSPNLFTFIGLYRRLKEISLKSPNSLSKKFAHRKLYTAGLCVIRCVVRDDKYRINDLHSQYSFSIPILCLYGHQNLMNLTHLINIFIIDIMMSIFDLHAHYN